MTTSPLSALSPRSRPLDGVGASDGGGLVRVVAAPVAPRRAAGAGEGDLGRLWGRVADDPGPGRDIGRWEDPLRVAAESDPRVGPGGANGGGTGSLGRPVGPAAG